MNMKDYLGLIYVVVGIFIGMTISAVQSNYYAAEREAARAAQYAALAQLADNMQVLKKGLNQLQSYYGTDGNLVYCPQ